MPETINAVTVMDYSIGNNSPNKQCCKCNTRILEKSWKLGFRKSGKPGFPENLEIPKMRICEKFRKSGFSGFPEIRENLDIRIFRISGFPENPEIRIFRISGIPDSRISQDSWYYSYSINCSGNYFRCCNPLQLQD